MACERGTVLPAVLGVLLAGALVLAVAVDLTRWASAHREAASAAAAAAQAGAAMVSEPALRVGLLQVDPARAITAASETGLAARPRDGRSVSATVADNEVCAVVNQPFRSSLLAALGSSELVVRGTACAVPVRG